MAKNSASIVIKKYANRRLYNTKTSAYVTLEDLAEMVRLGQDFTVQDAKSGEEITRGVLGQIIFDAESRGSGLLPIAFLRQLITFYDGQMHAVVPAYLEHALATFAREQGRLSRQINTTLGVQAISTVEEQVRRNMDMFERSIRMFMPYAADPAPASPPPSTQREPDDHLAKDVAALRDELASMQAKIAALGSPPAAGSPALSQASAPVLAPASMPPPLLTPALTPANQSDVEIGEEYGLVVDAPKSRKA